MQTVADPGIQLGGEHHPDRGQFNVSKCLAFISSLELGQSIAKLDGGGHGQIFPQDPPLFADQGDFNLVVTCDGA